MKLATGTVIDGKVVFLGEPLPDGMKVTVLTRDDDETFDVSPDLAVELEHSLAEAAAGQTVSADEVLRRLRKPA
jgi:hypothetical protein